MRLSETHVVEMIRSLIFQVLGLVAVLFLGEAIADVDGVQSSKIIASMVLFATAIVVAASVALRGRKIHKNRTAESSVLKRIAGMDLQWISYFVTLSLFSVCIWERAVNGKVFNDLDALIIFLLIALVMYVSISIVLILRHGFTMANAREDT
jgi:hypothetical protein